VEEGDLMRKNAHRYVGPLVVMLLLLAVSSHLSISPFSAQAATATVSVIPSSVVASVGQNFSVNITAASVSNLYGWEFWLSWNSDLLSVSSVVEGPFLKAGGGSNTFFYYTLNSTGGYMVADSTLLGQVPGVSGSGTLSTITFEVENAGECPINLYNATLVDPSNNDIPSTISGGYGHFSGPQDVAVASVDVSPITVYPGTIVNINVTVQNLGNSAETFNVTVFANSKNVGVNTVTALSSGSSATIPFVWNTTGYGKGDYTILASASVVPGEVNVANNNKTASDPVTILTFGHDVAVIHVNSFKTIIGQDYSSNITVTAKNYGSYIEQVTVTLYVNSTTIGTQTTNLTSGASAPLIFQWSTVGFAKGTYVTWAYATSVPGESDTSNNNCTGQSVFVTILGDVNGDKNVDMTDAMIELGAFASVFGSPRYDPNCDLNNDLQIDMTDIMIELGQFGQTWT
jgi:hypothetical protein